MSAHPRAEEMSGFFDESAIQKLERVMTGSGLNGDPAKRGELVNSGLSAESAIARSLHSTKRHLRFVMYSRPIDVADSALHAHGQTPGMSNVPAEDRG